MKDPDYFVHPSSVIDQPCSIGSGTKIWHFCHVMEDVQIGENCSLGQNVFVAQGVIIGSNVKIQNNVSIYNGVQLEDHVFCGPSCVFTNIKNPRSEIVRRHEYVRTLVRRGVSIGANAILMCGITIGQYAFIGAGAVVLKDVPDFALIVGNPGHSIGWMCVCGERLMFNEEENRVACSQCERSYSKEGDKVALDQV